MGQKYQIKLTKLNWQQNLGAAVMGIGILGIIEASAQALPTQNTFQLAQVGVRSQINAPTSLNITPPPGSHIPLPESNYHEYGSYDHEHRGYSEDYIYYRDSSGYRRHESNYDDDYYHHERHTHRHKDKKGGSIIIINLPSQTNYDRTENTYIRVLRR